MKLKQDKLIKTLRISFIVLIALFMGLSAYNAVTNNKKTAITTEKRDACSGCPNKNKCSKVNTDSQCIDETEKSNDDYKAIK